MQPNHQRYRVICKIAISWVLIWLTAVCFADSQFNDYTILRPTARNHNNTNNAWAEYYLATRKMIIPTQDPAYEDNVWHLSSREGLRLAQIDKVVTQIYQYFLYAPDEDIVIRVNSPEDVDYFIARRIIKQSKKWYQIIPHYSNEMQYIKDDEGHYVINGYSLYDDGTLIKGNVKKKISGLGQIIALAEFLGDWDVNNSNNISVQETENELKVYKIDNEKGFSYPYGSTFETLLKKLDEQISNNLLTDEIMNMPWLQAEKLIMFNKIAEADFSDFSPIAAIITQITVDACNDDDIYLTRKEISSEQQGLTLQESQDGQEWLEALKQSLIDDEATDTHQCGAEMILKELQMRQKQLRKYLGYTHDNHNRS